MGNCEQKFREYCETIKADTPDWEGLYKSAISKLVDQGNLIHALTSACELARDSQGWDSNDQDEERWIILYRILQDAIAKAEGK